MARCVVVHLQDYLEIQVGIQRKNLEYVPVHMFVGGQGVPLRLQDYVIQDAVVVPPLVISTKANHVVLYEVWVATAAGYSATLQMADIVAIANACIV